LEEGLEPRDGGLDPALVIGLVGAGPREQDAGAGRFLENEDEVRLGASKHFQRQELGESLVDGGAADSGRELPAGGGIEGERDAAVGVMAIGDKVEEGGEMEPGGHYSFQIAQSLLAAGRPRRGVSPVTHFLAFPSIFKTSIREDLSSLCYVHEKQ
jgi:hypothetical protein